MLNENEFAAAYSYGVSVFTRKNNIWLEKQIFTKRSFSVQYNKDALWFSSESGIINYKDTLRNVSIPELKDKRILDLAFLKK